VTERWTDPAFVAEAHGWIDARLAELGLPRTGEIEQPHVRDWSTVMRVPTEAGHVWFKVNDARWRHEAALVSVLAQRAPDRVPPLLACDTETGWMLMADAGRRLREVAAEERSLDRWPDVLAATARIQLACEDDVDTFLAMGVPDLRLAALPAAYQQLLEEHGDELEPRLQVPHSRIEELCAELASYGVRETIEHDDLHDAQVFLSPHTGTALVMDWGDACVTHPFFTLSVTLMGVVAWGVDDVAGSEDLGRHLDAYLGPYRERYDGDLDAAAQLAMRLGWVCRAVNGYLPDDGHQVSTRMRMFLDGTT
jgi:hypothetical protein